MLITLKSIARLLDDLGRVATEPVLAEIAEQDSRMASDLSVVVEMAPIEIVHALGYLCRTMQPAAAGLAFDPRDHAECASAVLAMDRWATTAGVRSEIERQIGRLVEEGVLGLEALVRIQRFLQAVSLRPGQVKRRGNELVVADEQLERYSLERLAMAYRRPIGPEILDLALAVEVAP